MEGGSGFAGPPPGSAGSAGVRRGPRRVFFGPSAFHGPAGPPDRRTAGQPDLPGITTDPHGPAHPLSRAPAGRLRSLAAQAAGVARHLAGVVDLD